MMKFFWKINIFVKFILKKGGIFVCCQSFITYFLKFFVMWQNIYLHNIFFNTNNDKGNFGNMVLTHFEPTKNPPPPSRWDDRAPPPISISLSLLCATSEQPPLLSPTNPRCCPVRATAASPPAAVHAQLHSTHSPHSAQRAVPAVCPRPPPAAVSDRNSSPHGASVLPSTGSSPRR